MKLTVTDLVGGVGDPPISIRRPGHALSSRIAKCECSLYDLVIDRNYEPVILIWYLSGEEWRYTCLSYCTG